MPRLLPSLSKQRTQSAFTLVELLVVLGIVALLIGLLLPSLAVARQAAQRTACVNKLRQIMVAAQMHLIDHKGFFPMVGVLPAIEPEDLTDPYSSKYDYFSYDFYGQKRMIAPITIALATEMSNRQARDVLSNVAVGTAETDSKGFIQNFLCPSQASSVDELPQMPMLWLASSIGFYYWEQQSYIYNEAALGWNDSLNRGQGRYTSIHQPWNTLFATDGLMGSATDSRFSPFTSGAGMATLYNMVPNAPVTMADALTGAGGKAGDPQSFDRLRHHGKINIAFCDCHVETRNITPADLSTIFLLAP